VAAPAARIGSTSVLRGLHLITQAPRVSRVTARSTEDQAGSGTKCVSAPVLNTT